MCDAIWASPTIGATNFCSVGRQRAEADDKFLPPLVKVEELKVAFSANGLNICRSSTTMFFYSLGAKITLWEQRTAYIVPQ